METVTDFILGGSKFTADGDCSHEIKRCLLLGRKVITNLDSIFREGNGTPLQENPMDGGGWWAAVHGVVKSWTRLNNFTFTYHFHALEKEMATHSSGESQGQRSLVGCRLWGHTKSVTTEVT